MASGNTGMPSFSVGSGVVGSGGAEAGVDVDVTDG